LEARQGNLSLHARRVALDATDSGLSCKTSPSLHRLATRVRTGRPTKCPQQPGDVAAARRLSACTCVAGLNQFASRNGVSVDSPDDAARTGCPTECTPQVHTDSPLPSSSPVGKGRRHTAVSRRRDVIHKEPIRHTRRRDEVNVLVRSGHNIQEREPSLPNRLARARPFGNIQTDTHAVSALHRLGHVIVQHGSTWHVRRVPD